MRNDSTSKKQKQLQYEIESQTRVKKRHCQKVSERLLKQTTEQDIKSFSLEQSISSLQKEPCTRSANDLLSIKAFLETSELCRKFNSDNISEDSLQKILLMCSTEMRYLNYPKEKILFRIGDDGNYFYIIIKGKIEILKPISDEEMISGFEYFNHITTLYESNEIYILKKTIEANQFMVHMDLNEMPLLKKILLAILLDDFYMDSTVMPAEILNVIESCHINIIQEQLDINKDHLDDVNYFISIKKLLSNYIGDIPNKTLERYRGLKQKNLKTKYSLFKYQSFLQLENGAFFGDMALDKKTFRSATIKTIDETEFCYLDIQSYNSFLLAEKQRLTLNEVAFLVNSFFFKAISFFVFERKYLNSFIYQENYKKDVLFQEETKVDYIYFIKEGQVELKTKKSVFEIHSLITSLSEFGSHNNDKDDQKRLPICKNDFENIKQHLKKTIEYNLFITNGKECIGQESLYYGLNYLYTARVITKKCKLYKIDVRSLLKLFQVETMSYDWFAYNCKNKIKLLKERLKAVKESQICLANSVIQTENNVNDELFSFENKINTISTSAALIQKTKRVLKCRIKQIIPLSSFFVPRITINNNQMLSLRGNSEHSKRLESIEKKFATISVTQEELTYLTPISKGKKKNNNNNMNYSTLLTKDNTHRSLITETRLLSKIQKEIENDPIMITNNNFITIANKKQLLKIKDRTHQTNKKMNDIRTQRRSIPKLSKPRTRDKTIVYSRNVFIMEKQNNTIENKHNTYLENEISSSQIKTDFDFSNKRNSNQNNISILTMFSGKYFKEKQQLYQQYKHKLTNNYTDNKIF